MKWSTDSLSPPYEMNLTCPWTHSMAVKRRKPWSLRAQITLFCWIRSNKSILSCLYLYMSAFIHSFSPSEYSKRLTDDMRSPLHRRASVVINGGIIEIRPEEGRLAQFWEKLHLANGRQEAVGWSSCTSCWSSRRKSDLFVRRRSRAASWKQRRGAASRRKESLWWRRKCRSPKSPAVVELVNEIDAKWGEEMSNLRDAQTGTPPHLYDDHSGSRKIRMKNDDHFE